jgi:hypothetical protein
MGFVQVQAQRKEAEHSPGLVCPYCGRQIEGRSQDLEEEGRISGVANAVTVCFGLRRVYLA